MMLQANGWQSEFSQGFAAGGAPVDPGIILTFLGLIAAGFGAWYLVSRFTRGRADRPREREVDGTLAPPKARAKFVAVAGRLNPLQQKVIQELIDEFRKQDASAQAVPSAILEKYSEFLYSQVGRLKTNDKDVEKFINNAYPLKAGATVELDFLAAGTLHLIKTKVVEVEPKVIEVEYTSPMPEFLKKGAALKLNYSVGRHFLQGSSVITDVIRGAGLLLRKPHEVILTSERRYSRLMLRKSVGSLSDPKTDFQETVKVLDLSFEGVRIQVGRPLAKNHIHLLTFEEVDNNKSWLFGPIECMPSKAFLTGSGTYEAGLLFLYLDVAARAKLSAYMKHRAQEAQAAKAPAAT